MKESEFVLQS